MAVKRPKTNSLGPERLEKAARRKSTEARNTEVIRRRSGISNLLWRAHNQLQNHLSNREAINVVDGLPSLVDWHALLL
jgi:hypothetical protein